MTTGDEPGGEIAAQGQTPTNPVDFAFLVAQTFGDVALEREVLELFVVQVGAILRDLPDLPHRQQGELAHRLKGSARGIGAWSLAEAADGYEQAPATERPAVFGRLAAVADAVLRAIARHRAQR